LNVKVTSLTEALRFAGIVREKKDQRDGQGQPQQQQHQKSRDQETGREVSGNEIDEAIASFQKDAQASSNGLTATATGQGFGLRVVLKDGSGAVIRQLTGEEFVKLREAASQQSRPRGKILDQKL
jgi:hypothetical protein